MHNDDLSGFDVSNNIIVIPIASVISILHINIYTERNAYILLLPLPHFRPHIIKSLNLYKLVNVS